MCDCPPSTIKRRTTPGATGNCCCPFSNELVELVVVDVETIMDYFSERTQI